METEAYWQRLLTIIELRRKYVSCNGICVAGARFGCQKEFRHSEEKQICVRNYIIEIFIVQA